MSSSLHTANTNERHVHQSIVYNWLKSTIETREKRFTRLSIIHFGASKNKKAFRPNSFQIRIPNGSLQTNGLRVKLRLLHGYAKDLMEVQKNLFFLNQSLGCFKAICGSLTRRSLTHPMVITALFILIDPKITRSFPWRMGPEALPTASVRFEAATFQSKVDTLSEYDTFCIMSHNFIWNGRINLTENKSLLRNSST